MLFLLLLAKQLVHVTVSVTIELSAMDDEMFSLSFLFIFDPRNVTLGF